MIQHVLLTPTTSSTEGNETSPEDDVRTEQPTKQRISVTARNSCEVQFQKVTVEIGFETSFLIPPYVEGKRRHFRSD